LKAEGNYSSVHISTYQEEGSIVYSLSATWVSESKTRTSIYIGEGRSVEDEVGMYMNHSCQPSCKIDGLNVVAIKNMEAEEEVTFDYASEGPLASPFFCNCCGIYIDGEDK
jgi:hypothetical protein